MEDILIERNDRYFNGDAFVDNDRCGMNESDLEDWALIFTYCFGMVGTGVIRKEKSLQWKVILWWYQMESSIVRVSSCYGNKNI